MYVFMYVCVCVCDLCMHGGHQCLACQTAVNSCQHVMDFPWSVSVPAAPHWNLCSLKDQVWMLFFYWPNTTVSMFCSPLWDTRLTGHEQDDGYLDFKPGRKNVVCIYSMCAFGDLYVFHYICIYVSRCECTCVHSHEWVGGRLGGMRQVGVRLFSRVCVCVCVCVCVFMSWYVYVYTDVCKQVCDSMIRR